MDPNFFGLSGNPFAQSDATETPCLAEEHLALTAELHAGLKAPHGITLLIGDQGAGKTTFIRHFLAQLPDSYVVAYLPTAGPGLRHLLTEIIEQLGGTVTAGGQEQALIDTVRALAKARAEHERATLVVIDEAHELPAKTIERLGKLFGPDAADPSRLHVALVGRPELLDRMNAANDRSILKHLVQVCRMDAIGPEDAFRYIADRVQKVGGIVDRLFSEDALRLIVQRANGNPARIDQLCTGALERAEGRGLASVDAAAVEAASNGGEVAANGGAGMADEQPETPTYFFNEDDDEQRAPQGTNNVRTVADARALPKEGAAVAVPASRQRLAYWAAGAIAVVIALAVVMTRKDLPLRGDQSTAGEGGEPAQTAAAAKTPRPAVGVSTDTQAATGEPLAVPKLVVKRGAKAGASRNAETQGAAASPGAGAAAQPAPEAATERPRFPAPPLPPPADAPAKPVADPAAAAAAGMDAAAPPPAAAAGAGKAAASPAVKPETAATQVAAPTVAATQAATAEPAVPAAAPTAAAQPRAIVKPAPIPPTRAVAPAPAAAPSKPTTVAPPAPTQTAAAKPAPAKAAATGRYTVQLGAFSSRANAEALLAKARSVASDGRIIASTAGGKSVFRVVAGSFATQSEANTHATALKKSGYTPFVRALD